jgi:hypothetical protein
MVRPRIRRGWTTWNNTFNGPPAPDTRFAKVSALSAAGVDVQWARGRWSVSGEWQHFRFDSPNFVVSPALTSTYGEVKTVLTPRLFLAARMNGSISSIRREHVSMFSGSKW